MVVLNSIKKIFPKLIISIIILIVLLIIIFSLNDINAIANELANVNYLWLMVAFAFLLLYILFNPLSLYILGNSNNEKHISLYHSYMIGTIEYFFNGITPFASGGQPFQVYEYNKIGVPYHRSSGILLFNFVVTQIAIVILCLFSLFYYQQLTNGQLYLQILIIIGLTINIFILFLFCSFGLSKRIKNVFCKIVSWFFSLKIFKQRFTKNIIAFEEYCLGAQKTFKGLLKEKGKFIVCIFLKLCAFIFYYMIPFFILKALNIEVDIAALPMITAMTTFSIAMTCFIPTPGSSGGIEFAFKSLFVIAVPAISSSASVSGMLLWRLLTYYILMFISFVVYLILELTNKKNLKEISNID